jgi:hypothetical protein
MFYVWVAKSAKVDPTWAHSLLESLAKSELSSEEYQLVSIEGSDDVCMYLPAPPRQELRSALLEDDGQPFVDLIVKHFDGMARFILGLDKLLLKAT